MSGFLLRCQRQQQRELFPANAPHHIVGAHRTGDQRRHMRQRKIPRRVAVPIVDALEIVDIQNRDGQRRLRRHRRCNDFFRARDEGTSGEHASQIVVGGQPLHAVGQPVVREQHHADGETRQGQRRHAEKQHVQGRRLQKHPLMRQTEGISERPHRMDDSAQRRGHRHEVVGIFRTPRRTVLQHHPADVEANVGDKARHQGATRVDVRGRERPVKQQTEDDGNRAILPGVGRPRVEELPEALHAEQRGDHQQAARSGDDDVGRAAEQQRGRDGQHAACHAP